MTSKLVLNAVGGDLEETITLVGGAEVSAGAGEVVVDLERMHGELAGLIAEGVIGAEVAATYPLEEHVDALRHAQRTGRNGKVLFVPAQAAR